MEKPKRTTGPEIPKNRITKEFIVEQRKEFLRITKIDYGTLDLKQKQYIDTLFSTSIEKSASRSKILLQRCIREINFKSARIQIKLSVDNLWTSFKEQFPDKEADFEFWLEVMRVDYLGINKEISVSGGIETRTEMTWYKPIIFFLISTSVFIVSPTIDFSNKAPATNEATNQFK